MNDMDIRRAIIEQDGNIVISANAGSGKTSIMVKKIEHELKNNKKHFTIAATTFTNKAAIEIKDRVKQMKLGSIINRCFIGTNDSFVMDEIIKPFFKDVFGIENRIEIDYSEKFDTYDEGLEIIKAKSKLGTYRYKSKNFKFELALIILQSSLAARRYLKSKYFKMFIDEYQDCDIDMHNLYMYIYKNLNIDLFVVGDIKQSIYTWRGANPKFLNDLSLNDEFTSFKLSINFRATKEIQNYVNFFLDEDIEMYEITNKSDSIIFIDSKDSQGIFKIINSDKRICFIVRTNDEAKRICDYLNTIQDSPNDFIYIPKTPLSKISSESIWIGDIIAKIVFNKSYNEYMLKNDIPMDIDMGYLKKVVRLLKEFDDINDIVELIKDLYNKLGYELNLAEQNAIINTITDSQYSINYKNIELNHVVTTIHSSKGLEYDEVIILAKHYNLNKIEDKNNHYVAITRAKEKLVIFYNKDDYISNKYIDYLLERVKIKGLTEEEISKYIIVN